MEPPQTLHPKKGHTKACTLFGDDFQETLPNEGEGV
jgi:hypothetical protein